MSAGNSVFRVLVRVIDGLWVFDDSKFGIREQPFVFGSDLILEKMVADALEMAGFYKNDSYIAQKQSEKIYCDLGEETRTEICLTIINNDDKE